MKPSNLFKTDDRAVSPVIGVILMVAITVILAAVIGTFVLGLGDSLGSSQPTAQFDVDIGTDSTNKTLTIEHGGGDPIESEDLTVIVTEVGTSNEVEATEVFSSRFSVGDTATSPFATENTSADATDIRIRVIHTPSDSVLLDRTSEVEDVGTFASNTDFKSGLNS